MPGRAEPPRRRRAAGSRTAPARSCGADFGRRRPQARLDNDPGGIRGRPAQRPPESNASMPGRPAAAGARSRSRVRPTRRCGSCGTRRPAASRTGGAAKGGTGQDGKARQGGAFLQRPKKQGPDFSPARIRGLACRQGRAEAPCSPPAPLLSPPPAAALPGGRCGQRLGGMPRTGPHRTARRQLGRAPGGFIGAGSRRRALPPHAGRRKREG